MENTIIERRRYIDNRGISDLVYILGFIGALVYFIQTASSLIDGLIGILQALVWPAFIVYRVFAFIGA